MLYFFILFFSFFQNQNHTEDKTNFSIEDDSLHNFHVSIAEVDYNTSSKSFEVSLKVFTDDLEKALGRKYQLGRVYLNKSKKYNEYIAKYIKANFYILNSKKQKIKMSFLGKELENDVIWIYFEFPYKSSPKSLKLHNSVLVELFSDQTNMVNTNYKGQKKTHKFKRGYTETPYNLK